MDKSGIIFAAVTSGFITLLTLYIKGIARQTYDNTLKHIEINTRVSRLEGKEAMREEMNNAAGRG